jgi:glycosyltransferase involved in cell wall biosynthesis
LAVRLVDAVVTASLDTFPYPTSKRIATGHGIDTNFYRPMDTTRNSNEMRVLSTGRITPTKNQLLMCQAMKLLRDRGHKHIRLNIYGQPFLETDKVYCKKIEEYIAKENLQHQVYLMGYAENRDMPNIYNSHDLFLNLAGKTGIDKAGLEAMACGLNILTSNRTFKSILPPGYFLEDSEPETVAEGILSFVDKREKNAVLREIVVKRNNLDDLVQRFYDILS